MSEQRPEPAPDAGINLIRLDADRARHDLENTLDEIEARLNPQRVIEPVKKTVASAKSAYKNRPVEFIAVAVGIIGALGGLVIWGSRGSSGRG